MIDVRMIKQSYNFVWFSFDPGQFAWAKNQPIREGGLIAHISLD